MTQEDKELLLKDICARLPYGVHVEISWEYSKTDVHTGLEYYEFPNINSLLNIFWDKKCISIKPYLRPMSSMTEEEDKEFAKVMVISQDCSYANNESATTMVNDWYLSKGFDVRGLIPKGLALEAPEGMY